MQRRLQLVFVSGDKAGESWKLHVKVRQCLFQGQGWTVDCGLVTSPTRSELLRALGGLIAKM